jgi:hypothetical protein
MRAGIGSCETPFQPSIATGQQATRTELAGGCSRRSVPTLCRWTPHAVKRGGELAASHAVFPKGLMATGTVGGSPPSERL